VAEGLLYRPLDETANSTKRVDYMGKGRVIFGYDRNDDFTGFVGRKIKGNVDPESLKKKRQSYKRRDLKANYKYKASSGTLTRKVPTLDRSQSQRKGSISVSTSDRLQPRKGSLASPDVRSPRTPMSGRMPLAARESSLNDVFRPIEEINISRDIGQRHSPSSEGSPDDTRSPWSPNSPTANKAQSFRRRPSADSSATSKDWPAAPTQQQVNPSDSTSVVSSSVAASSIITERHVPKLT
jgi:hypothetical protein